MSEKQHCNHFYKISFWLFEGWANMHAFGHDPTSVKSQCIILFFEFISKLCHVKTAGHCDATLLGVAYSMGISAGAHVSLKLFSCSSDWHSTVLDTELALYRESVTSAALSKHNALGVRVMPSRIPSLCWLSGRVSSLATTKHFQSLSVTLCQHET
jgi:hypothetical protein